MMSEFKMSDYFDKPVEFVGDTIECPDFAYATTTCEWEVNGVDYGHAIAHAINQHDKLVEENQRLTTDRNNATGLMSPSWQHAYGKEPDLMTRYVTMAENQFKKKNEEISRLTAIATKHATRDDELYEALERVCSYLSEDGLINTGLEKDIVNAQRVLSKLQIDAVSNSNDD
ncbi:coil containing protein [Vibrio phage vB_VnaS-L3]|nr:coil containing protein [Vibrio phage vB_VnaS-L3]